MLLRLVAIVLIAFCVGARAAAPKQVSAFGIDLGMTPQTVASTLAERYQVCNVVKSIYHASEGDTAEHIAALEINPGLTFNDIGAPDVCSYSPAGDGITDSIEARFLHPAIERDQAVYSIEAKRVYPDVVYSPLPRLRNSFDELRSELFKTYGRPIDERRERVASSAANLAASLGIGQNVKREDFLVRYLWAQKGRLTDVENEDWYGGDLSGQSHAQVRFTGIDLTEATNNGALFSECTFRDCDFNASTHTDAAFVNCTFVRCSLFDTTFTRCKMVGSFFDDCTYNLLKVNGGDWSFTALPGADLKGTDFSGAKFREAELTGIRAAKASLRDLDLSGASLQRADLTGADLRGSDLSTLDPLTVTLRDARIDMTQAMVVAASLGLDVRP